MFWGYTPALDVLREYFWWRDKPPCPDVPGEGQGREAAGDPGGDAAEPVGGVTITELTDPADWQQSQEVVHEGHVEEDDAPDDGGGRVIGELLLPAGGAAAAPLQGHLHGERGGGRDAGEPRQGAGRQPGSVPPADGHLGGRHVHLDGTVVVQPRDGRPGCERDHAVRADCQTGPLLPPPLPAQDHLRDAARHEEVATPPHRGRAARVPGAAGDPLGLFEVEPKRQDHESAGDTLDILLVGGMDCRHVLKTLSRLHCHADALGEQPDHAGDASRTRRRRVRFFVAETVMELVARQLLFILAALEPPDRLGRTEKVRLLMELFGNALVRPSTALWLRHASRALVDLVTDDSALRRRLPLVDLSHLRHRDRDRLEEVLAFYQERPQAFRVGYHWDQRLRRHLAVRYDSRAGVFDWDYYMVLKDLEGGEKVCVHEYRHWRETGVAFTWLETEQTEPNLSLAAGIVREGSHLLHGGYLGDIVTSPYIAFSVELEPEDAADIFRKANDQYVSRSTDAAERHLERITHELQHQRPYHPVKDGTRDDGGVILTRVTDERRLNPEVPPDEDDATLRKAQRASDMMSYSSLPVEDAEVVFLSPRFLQAPVEGRGRYKGRFHAAVLGLGLGERHLDRALVGVLAPGAVVLVEGPRFLMQRAEARQQAAGELLQRARDAGLAPLKPFHPDKDDYAKFVLDAG